MDANILCAALRSRLEASFTLLHRLRHGEWLAVVSNHLVHEHEEVLKRPAAELGLSLAEAGEWLNALCARAEAWPLQPGWRPVLSDPDDEPLVQLACESSANRIVTHKLRQPAPPGD